MSSTLRFLRLPLAVALASFILTPFVTAEEPRAAVPKSEQIKFEQDKALANMRELEERMFRLADLIRSLRPEDSARLLMGVQRAREHLIADRMNEASKLLASLKLNQAAAEQTEIITKLEELKKLLLTSDLDLEIKLDQLGKINTALNKLDGLINKEQQQRSSTGELSDQEASPSAESLNALKEGEERNQKAGEQLAELTRQVGPAAAAAAASLDKAAQAMNSAAGQLGQGQPKPAGQKQGQAIADLNDAKTNLAQLQQQLREEVEGLVRQLVLTHLKDMLAQQSQVRGATEKLVPRVAEGSRQAVLATKKLSPAEDRITEVAAKSHELVELTQFSMVLPVALTALKGQMELVSTDLGTGNATPQVVGDEQNIEASLKSLIDAMEDASRASDEPGGQCKGCKGNKNKLLSEVKMLRWMQASLNLETSKTDAAIKNSENPTDLALLRRTQTLRQQQSDIRGIAQELHSKTCQDCLQGTH